MNTAGYRAEVNRELHAILLYWMEYTPDLNRGGFVGRVDEDDRPHPEAAKGVVLNSRILWTFSAAWSYTGREVYRPMADRAYDYLLRYFLDKEYGGVFWSLDAAGRPLDPRKQIYGQAFSLYGLSEYYRATGEKTALNEAISLFQLIEQFSFDRREKGYYEAFARDWSLLEDVRLSEKEANDPKTMNTHLHILEAYTNLYRVWPDPLLLSRLLGLLNVFDRYIIGATGHPVATAHSAASQPGAAAHSTASRPGAATVHPGVPAAHLGLFFNPQWKGRRDIISYGHDIEAAWLLHEAALVIKNNEWITKTGELALRLTAAAAEGLDTDGGLWYEREDGRLVRQKHWWPQAEAMVGFLQAWQLSGDVQWWQRSLDSWDFIRKYIRHPEGKEWYWGVEADHSPMPGQDKAGFWKCPYHNSRACLEIMRRLDQMGSTVT